MSLESTLPAAKVDGQLPALGQDPRRSVRASDWNALRAEMIAASNDVMNVRHYGAVGDGTWTGSAWTGTDNTAALQAALDAAAVLITDATSSDLTYHRKGGAVVRLGAGVFKINGTIKRPANVTLIGAGIHSTLIVCGFNGTCIRNDPIPGGGSGTYDIAGGGIHDLAIVGDRTLSSQVLLDLLRPVDERFSNLLIEKSGGIGLRVRQALGSRFERVTARRNVGAGISVGAGINSWSDPTDNPYPSNSNHFLRIHCAENDGPGFLFAPTPSYPAWNSGTTYDLGSPVTSGGIIYVSSQNGNLNHAPPNSSWWGTATGTANGNVVEGDFELNYLATANATTGHQIEVRGSSFMPNTISPWTEGAGLAHILVSMDGTTERVLILNWKHLGAGAAGNVGRAILVTKGYVEVINAFGHGDSYVQHASGSTAPLRLNKANGAHITARECYGSGVLTADKQVDDENGLQTGLNDYRSVENGPQRSGTRYTYSQTGDWIEQFYIEGDTNPWLRWNPANGMQLGPGGGGAPDTAFYRTGNGLLQVNGLPLGRKVSVPSTATSTGVPGDFAADASWFYACTATNTWRRVGIASW